MEFNIIYKGMYTTIRYNGKCVDCGLVKVTDGIVRRFRIEKWTEVIGDLERKTDVEYGWEDGVGNMQKAGKIDYTEIGDFITIDVHGLSE